MTVPIGKKMFDAGRKLTTNHKVDRKRPAGLMALEPPNFWSLLQAKVSSPMRPV